MNADYGIDAPGVVRNLALIGAACFVVAILGLAGVVPRQVTIGAVTVSSIGTFLPPALGFFFGAAWMYFGSRYGKIKERERLLDKIAWRGDERVLDVGCGRGLMLVGAAKRVPKGSAVGIDIWQAEDLSGNRPEVPLENAKREGVETRVTVESADMRKLPFENGSFDVVVSRAAIHNVYDPRGRDAAIREIARVLAPGGRAVISDIRHMPQYTKQFEESGCRDVRLTDSKLGEAWIAIVTLGSLRPNTMVVKKD
ncbi:MAG TPA: class I SAM-dependent methyltransferase [Candidatus Polarisedimenticolaceae bacterium]|nr:class I SAM-dependent methyltransferase [Candidatus Polarisedimenticolaceae bacterium]